MLLIDWGNIVAVEENPVDTEGCAIAVDPLNKFIYWTEELPSVEIPAKFNNKISSLNEFNSEQRKLKRNFFSSIIQVDLDNSGRFLIPKNMLSHAKINRDAIICGMGNVIEIWNNKMYKKYLINDSETYSELAQKYLDD